MRYARVLCTNGTSVTLRVARDGADFLSGYEVDREGCRLERHGAQQLHVIARAAITRITPLQVSLTYGTLEKAAY